MSAVLLPLEGMLVRLDLPDDGYRRHILAEVLLAVALNRRVGKPVRHPHQFARKVLSNCLADVASGGETAGARAVAMKTHVITSSERSRAGLSLPLNVIGDLLFHGQVRRAPGEAFDLDHRDLVRDDHLAAVRSALSGLLGLGHEADPGCDCRPCHLVATGDWTALLERQQVNAVVVRELYEQAVLLGYPSLEPPAARTVPWQVPAVTEVSAAHPTWVIDPDEF